MLVGKQLPPGQPGVVGAYGVERRGGGAGGAGGATSYISKSYVDPRRPKLKLYKCLAFREGDGDNKCPLDLRDQKAEAEQVDV